MTSVQNEELHGALAWAAETIGPVTGVRRLSGGWTSTMLALTERARGDLGAPADGPGAVAHARAGAHRPRAPHAGDAGRLGTPDRHVPGPRCRRTALRSSGTPDVPASGLGPGRAARPRLTGPAGRPSREHPRGRAVGGGAALRVVGVRGEVPGAELGHRRRDVGGGLRRPPVRATHFRADVHPSRLPAAQRALGRRRDLRRRGLGGDVDRSRLAGRRPLPSPA